jgi:uncharacterized protein
MRIICIFFLAFLLLSSSCFAQETPSLQKHVSDYANVLTDEEEAQINSLCQQIESNWTVEIAVLTVNTTQPLAIEEYSVQAFEQNGIGKKETNNGLLIVAAINDRKWRFEVGYGLEPIINDAKAGRIGRTYLTPYFQSGEYGHGLYYALDAVGKVIQNSGDDSFIAGETDDEFTLAIIVIFMVFMFLIPIMIALTVMGILHNKCPKCGSRMRCKYEGDVLVCECPKCGKKTRKKRKDGTFWFFVGGLGGSGSGGGGGGGFGGGSSGGGGASGGW